VAEELALAVVDAGAERRDGDGRREVREDGVEGAGAARGGEEQRRHGGPDLAGEAAAGRGQRAEARVHGWAPRVVWAQVGVIAGGGCYGRGGKGILGTITDPSARPADQPGARQVALNKRGVPLRFYHYTPLALAGRHVNWETSSSAIVADAAGRLCKLQRHGRSQLLAQQFTACLHCLAD